jgi:hypothetical protein
MMPWPPHAVGTKTAERILASVSRFPDRPLTRGTSCRTKRFPGVRILDAGHLSGEYSQRLGH